MLKNWTKALLVCANLAWLPNVAQAQHIGSTSPIAGYLQKSPMWTQYKSRFMGSEGRIIDNANKNISHSEGQGYGMLLALAASDQQAFDKIYSFAKDNLQVRNDSLFAWKYEDKGPSHVPDKNNASDGDILIAWALMEAAEAGWGDHYRYSGEQILADLKKLLVSNDNLGLLIKPGEVGFDETENGFVINPSYYVFPALERLSELTGDIRWKRLAGSGQYLVEQLSADGRKGVPNWAIIKPLATNATLHPKKSSVFGYEAIRVPLYLMMGENTKKQLAYDIVNEVRDSSKHQLVQIDVKDGSTKGRFTSQGYTAIASLADCLNGKSGFSETELTKLDQHYYPATLQLLSILVANREANQCL